MENGLGIREIKMIDNLVDYFVKHQYLFDVLLNQVSTSVNSSPDLPSLIHSVKSRIKDPDHLRKKLIRKAKETRENGRKFLITEKNLFTKINDLLGFRIMHLHSKQIEQIDLELKKIFKEQSWLLIEGPTARTWDDEYREYFKNAGIKVIKSPSMYTSVHYVIKTNSSTSLTCEIQVRTLMEEVWGEVDHTMNYPQKTESLPCREQIKALARATSSCSRLVDSIFTTHNDFELNKMPKIKKQVLVKKKK